MGWGSAMNFCFGFRVSSFPGSLAGALFRVSPERKSLVVSTHSPASLAPTGDAYGFQSGRSAASLLIVIWLLIFLAPSRGFVPVLRSG